jgi:hypothetical protein
MRKEARGCGGRSSRFGGESIVLSLALLLAVGAAPAVGQASVGVDLSVESIHIGWTQRESLDLNQALVGDPIRISAAVQNVGNVAADQFEVVFFFTETITGEHGKLGTQVVSGLGVGAEARPVIVFDTTGFGPGIYTFSTEADPQETFGESDRCNNVAPRVPCGNEQGEPWDRYKVTLLEEGHHLSEPKSISLVKAQAQVPFEACQMGELLFIPIFEQLGAKIIVEIYNVGTEVLSIGDLEVWGYYRQDLTGAAGEFRPLVVDEDGNPVELSKTGSLGGPGTTGYVTITLKYDQFKTVFESHSTAENPFEDLGVPDRVQLRITMKPVATEGAVSQQDLFLPGRFQLADYYSTVDLWTFPDRGECDANGYDDITGVNVPPAAVGEYVFHVAATSSGDRLYALNVRSGDEEGTWSPSAAGVTLISSPVVFSDEDGAYRIYVAANDGRIYALKGMKSAGQAFLSSLWQSLGNIVIGDPFLSLSSDGTKLIVGSESGAYALNAYSGAVLSSNTSIGAVEAAPAYSQANETMWVVAGEGDKAGKMIYGIRQDGTVCSYDAGDRVTTSLFLNEDQTRLLFGSSDGKLRALDASSTGSTCVAKDVYQHEELTQIAGMAVVSDGANAAVYLTGELGDIAWVEYKETGGFKEKAISPRGSQPSHISVPPALLERDDDVMVVFVVGTGKGKVEGRPVLQGWESDLEEYWQVRLWGFDAPFVFKPEEEGVPPQSLLAPVVVVDQDRENRTLLVASSDGFLYAFDLE